MISVLRMQTSTRREMASCPEKDEKDCRKAGCMRKGMPLSGLCINCFEHVVLSGIREKPGSTPGFALKEWTKLFVMFGGSQSSMNMLDWLDRVLDKEFSSFIAAVDLQRTVYLSDEKPHLTLSEAIKEVENDVAKAQVLLCESTDKPSPRFRQELIELKDRIERLKSFFMGMNLEWLTAAEKDLVQMKKENEEQFRAIQRAKEAVKNLGQKKKVIHDLKRKNAHSRKKK